TSIGRGAFYNCTSLQNITIPGSVTSIGEEAFGYCSDEDSFESSEIDDFTITGAIGSEAEIYANENGFDFVSNGSVTEGDTSSYLTFELDEDGEAYSLASCPRSVSGEMVVPDTYKGLPVTSIGDSAFYGCSWLTSVTIPDSVKSVGDYAFYDCTSLGSITIPDSATSIGEEAFGYWSDEDVIESCKIEGFTITGTTGSEAERYANENGFEFISNGSVTPSTPVDPSSYLSFTLNEDEESYSVTGCSEDASGELVIPSTYNGLPVTSIGDCAFEYCESLTSITIPDNVTSIGENIFNACSALEEINVSTGNDYFASVDGVLFNKNKTTLIKMPEGAGQTSYIIPNSVTSIGDWAFFCCESLVNITIPNSVTSIGYSSFQSCSSLTSVTIPNGVTSIGDYAFYYCTSLANITISDSVKNIGFSAFSDTAYYNDEFNWENGDLYIGKHLIKAHITIVGSYTIVEGTKTIACAAFSGCNSLTSITIPDSVTSIGYSAFSDCSSLTSITIPDSVTSIGRNAFYDCTSLTSVTIPDGVTSIGWLAFCDCTSLTSVTIPGSVTSIGDEAFGYYEDEETYEYCKIEGFTIHGAQGSEAERYADDNGFTFVAVDSHTHNYTESITKQPTCTEAGTKTLTCSCGDVKTEAIPSKGHTEVTVAGKEATCTEAGLTEGKKCSVCGTITVAQQTIPSKGHTWNNGDLIAEPNCVESGGKIFTCTACGALKTESIPALGHDFSAEFTVDKEATVTEEGSKSKHCSRCDEKTEVTAIPKLTPPIATPVVKVANTAKGIKVTWNKVANAQKYVVYQRTYNAKTKKWSGWKALKSTTGLSYVDTTTKLGTIYR
ncbi:MAG: leucine-rich repeat domain-containing protein, partial [Clostridia bacterium]|nr:leucine-rich repeat domain-containing protein [Clostridia bacterium]